MLTILKVMFRLSYKKRITLPANHFQRLDDGLLMSYYIDGKLRFITINSREEAAQLMLDNGLIESFTGTGKNVRMYEKKVLTIAIDNKPVQWVRRSELKWNSVKFYPSDVIHFASMNEVEIQCPLQMLGLTTKHEAKVIPMPSQPITKRAA
jgi:hypothetical protein